MHLIETFPITEPTPRILLVTGGVFPPSSLVKVIRIESVRPAEIPLQMVLPVTLTVPGRCLEI